MGLKLALGCCDVDQKNLGSAVVLFESTVANLGLSTTPFISYVEVGPITDRLISKEPANLITAGRTSITGGGAIVGEARVLVQGNDITFETQNNFSVFNGFRQYFYSTETFHFSIYSPINVLTDCGRFFEFDAHMQEYPAFTQGVTLLFANRDTLNNAVSLSDGTARIGSGLNFVAHNNGRVRVESYINGGGKVFVGGALVHEIPPGGFVTALSDQYTHPGTASAIFQMTRTYSPEPETEPQAFARLTDFQFGRIERDAGFTAPVVLAELWQSSDAALTVSGSTLDFVGDGGAFESEIASLTLTGLTPLAWYDVQLEAVSSSEAINVLPHELLIQDRRNRQNFNRTTDPDTDIRGNSGTVVSRDQRYFHLSFQAQSDTNTIRLDYKTSASATFSLDSVVHHMANTLCYTVKLNGVEFDVVAGAGQRAVSTVNVGTINGLPTPDTTLTIELTGDGRPCRVSLAGAVTGEFSVTERFFTSGIEISFPVTYQGVTESIPFEIELCKDEVESATWGIAGEATVNEGDVVTYTVSLSGVLSDGIDASIDLSITDIDTTPADYESFTAAVNAAITAYTGTGALTFDGTTLTFTSAGDEMDDLTINLATIDDTDDETDEDFTVEISNPDSTTGANISGTGSVITTIIDNDTATGDDVEVTFQTVTTTITLDAAGNGSASTNITTVCGGIQIDSSTITISDIGGGDYTFDFSGTGPTGTYTASTTSLSTDGFTVQIIRTGSQSPSCVNQPVTVTPV